MVAQHQTPITRRQLWTYQLLVCFREIISSTVRFRFHGFHNALNGLRLAALQQRFLKRCTTNSSLEMIVFVSRFLHAIVNQKSLSEAENSIFLCRTRKHVFNWAPHQDLIRRAHHHHCYSSFKRLMTLFVRLTFLSPGQLHQNRNFTKIVRKRTWTNQCELRWPTKAPLLNGTYCSQLADGLTTLGVNCF